MKKYIALLLALCLLAALPACAAGAPDVSVRSAGAHDLELSLAGLPAGQLIVAVYRGGQMVTAAVAELPAQAQSAALHFAGSLQEGDRVKTFLLDDEHGAPRMPAKELSVPPLTPVPAPDPAPDPAPAPEPEAHSNILIACFSCTNNTWGVAEKLAQVTGGALYRITPAEPYTPADLNYNADCRANREQNDDAARPAIAGEVDDWAGYDVVFLGYPIWWGKAPRIIQTFLEGHDCAGKTIIPFCTSGSSPYHDATIKPLAPAANWLTGRRFAANVTQSALQEWVDGLDLPVKEDNAVNKLTVTFNGHSYTATLADNPSVDAFVAYLKSQGGSVTIAAHDYGSFEKVGELGSTIVQSNTQIDTAPGDIILYQGSNVCLYYSTNSWNFTRLGKLDGDLSRLRTDLGRGDVSITYALG